MTSIMTKRAGTSTHMLYSVVDSPLGRILIAGRGRGIALVSFLDGTAPARLGAEWLESRERFRDAEEQLAAYFRGSLERFDLELDLSGTEFQLDVWNELRRVPYGTTKTYAEVAAAIGRPRAVRAVGAANGANPVPVLIPCHRIIGSDGSLSGYRGGIEIKRFLLDLEMRG